MPKSGKATQRYRVLAGVSTRVRPDPSCEEWLHFDIGQVYERAQFPAHVPLEQLILSGHLVPLGEEGERG